jgi:hypothetical protein
MRRLEKEKNGTCGNGTSRLESRFDETCWSVA